MGKRITTSRPVKKRPPKNEAIQTVVCECIASGRYRLHPHVHGRMQQRDITQMDIKDVLLDGRREKPKDSYNEQFSEWRYAFRGCDGDGRELRVIVSEVAPGLLIITAIDLKKDTDHEK